MTGKKIPVHAELIKQWTDGAIIQWYSYSQSKWIDCSNNLPTWSPGFEYRVKPEPKPDVVFYGRVHRDSGHGWPDVTNFGVACDERYDNVMFVFDGETGKLKDAQVLASYGE